MNKCNLSEFIQYTHSLLQVKFVRVHTLIGQSLLIHKICFMPTFLPYKKKKKVFFLYQLEIECPLRLRCLNNSSTSNKRRFVGLFTWSNGLYAPHETLWGSVLFYLNASNESEKVSKKHLFCTKFVCSAQEQVEIRVLNIQSVAPASDVRVQYIKIDDKERNRVYKKE